MSMCFETALLLWNKLMQDKTSKQPKGTKKDVEALGPLKVKSTHFKYSSSKDSKPNYIGSKYSTSKL